MINRYRPQDDANNWFSKYYDWFFRNIHWNIYHLVRISFIQNRNNNNIFLTNLIFFFFVSEIGVGLAGFGIAFLFLGVLFLFDKGLLAIGNVRWLAASCITVHVLKKWMLFAYNTTILWDLWSHKLHINYSISSTINELINNVLTTQHHSTVTPKSKLHCLNFSISL